MRRAQQLHPTRPVHKMTSLHIPPPSHSLCLLHISCFIMCGKTGCVILPVCHTRTHTQTHAQVHTHTHTHAYTHTHNHTHTKQHLSFKYLPTRLQESLTASTETCRQLGKKVSDSSTTVWNEDLTYEIQLNSYTSTDNIFLIKLALKFQWWKLIYLGYLYK